MSGRTSNEKEGELGTEVREHSERARQGEIFPIWPFFETFFCKKTPGETIFKNRPFFVVM